MRVRDLLRAAAIVCAVFCCSSLQAQEAKQPDIMELLKKYGTPGPEHSHFDPLVGDWDVNVKMYEKPGDPPTEAKGKSSRKWILDKRFLQENFEGNFGGMPFSGFGLHGYDRLAKKYVGLWTDSVTTALQMMDGTYDPATKTFAYTYISDDPYMGGKMKCRDITRVLNDNEHIVEMFRAPAAGGQESKMLEIRYTRAANK